MILQNQLQDLSLRSLIFMAIILIKKSHRISCPFIIGSYFVEPLRSLDKADKVLTFLLTTHEYGSSTLGSQH